MQGLLVHTRAVIRNAHNHTIAHARTDDFYCGIPFAEFYGVAEQIDPYLRQKLLICAIVHFIQLQVECNLLFAPLFLQKQDAAAKLSSRENSVLFVTIC